MLRRRKAFTMESLARPELWHCLCRVEVSARGQQIVCTQWVAVIITGHHQ